MEEHGYLVCHISFLTSTCYMKQTQRLKPRGTSRTIQREEAAVNTVHENVKVENMMSELADDSTTRMSRNKKAAHFEKTTICDYIFNARHIKCLKRLTDRNLHV